MSENIKFNMAGIYVEQFSTFTAEIVNGIHYKVDSANKLVGCFMEFSFSQNKQPIIHLKVSCAFGIENKSWKEFAKEKGKIIIPEMFLEHMAAVTTGTSRGILFAKTEKTPFNNFLLPPLNVKELVQSDGVFEIE